MLKRTIVIQSPSFLSKKDNQLVVQQTDTGEEHSVPIEDIGVLLLEHYQITVTSALLAALCEAKAVVVPCRTNKLPAGLLLPIEGHHLQQSVMEAQLAVKKPVLKRAWQQLIRAKILNQAWLLELENVNTDPMIRWAKSVNSGDTKNLEARAARFYWQELFTPIDDFTRDPEGDPPNNLLNYGYAILRSVVARSVVGAGLHPTLGVKHQNQYNAFCLADDLMEPYRPWVDRIVREIVGHRDDYFTLNKPIKEALLQVPVLDVMIEGERRPLMIATQQTAVSLVKLYQGEGKTLALPVWP